MFDSNEINEYLTAYPNPTSPFTYKNIATLHHDYENSVPEAIEYMRAMSKLSDECMADNEDYRLYCRENEERRFHSPTPSLSTPHEHLELNPQSPQLCQPTHSVLTN